MSSKTSENQTGAALPAESGGGWRILVIDDEADIREILQMVLEDAGFGVQTAADGKTGLSLCEDSPPHIVITDIRMPGMDGLAVLEQLKSRQPDIEVIVITAFSDMDVAIRALQLDASDFITKPINEAALHVALSRARDRYTAKEEMREYTALLEQQNARTLRELIESHSFRDKLIEYSMDGILGCNGVHRIIIFNRSLQQMLGYTEKPALAELSLPDFFPAESLEAFFEALAGPDYGGAERLFLYETELLSKNRERVPMQVSASRLFDNGLTAGLVCFFRDLRQIRRLEQKLADQGRILHQDKMMSLGRLSASIVHEINNPLSGMLNYMRLMKRVLERGALSADDQKRFGEYLTLVESETRRCSRIVSSLLSFSRASEASFTSIDPGELLNRCLLLSQHKMELQHIAWTLDLPEGLPRIHGDFNQLQQCVINLIFNAVDVMPDGGRLELSAGAQAGGAMVRIMLCDTGPGIAESDLPRIFEPFFSTKAEGYGVGLGLSTVYGIIEQHGGWITAENRKQGGACFSMFLPASASK